MRDGASEEARRARRTQLLFREINDRIRAVGGRWRDSPGEPWEILCECGDESCIETILLTVEELEAIRRAGARFAVLPGHEEPELETVVERHEGYIVVEPVGEAMTLADAFAPRRAGQPA